MARVGSLLIDRLPAVSGHTALRLAFVIKLLKSVDFGDAVVNIDRTRWIHQQFAIFCKRTPQPAGHARYRQILEIDVVLVHDTRDNPKLVYVVGPRPTESKLYSLVNTISGVKQLDFWLFGAESAARPRRRLIGLGVDLPFLTALTPGR